MIVVVDPVTGVANALGQGGLHIVADVQWRGERHEIQRAIARRCGAVGAKAGWRVPPTFVPVALMNRAEFACAADLLIRQPGSRQSAVG